MHQSWYERLRAWREEIEAKLKKTWWLWPVSFAIELAWHRFYGWVNDYLDKHSQPIFAWAKTVTGHIPSDPITLAALSTLLIILGLTVHAYFDTRKIPAAPSPSRLTGIPPAAPATILSPAEHIASTTRRDALQEVKLLEKTLQGTKVAAQRITRQTHTYEARPPFVFEKAEHQWRIYKNGDCEAQTICHIRALDRYLDFWTISIGVEPEAPGITYLDEIDLKVADISGAGTGTDVAYLEGESSLRRKQISLFFLPRIDPNEQQPRIVRYRFKWHGMLTKLLEKGSESLGVNVDSRHVVNELKFKWEFEPGIGKMSCQHAGPIIRGVQPQEFQGAGGWSEWIYSLQNAPADKALYEFILRREKPPL